MPNVASPCPAMRRPPRGIALAGTVICGHKGMGRAFGAAQRCPWLQADMRLPLQSPASQSPPPPQRMVQVLSSCLTNAL